VALFASLLLWFGWDFFIESRQYYMVSDQIQVHARWVAACMPVTGAILAIHLVSGLALLESLHPETKVD
jgi:TRAP-type C4-dicarboxylate transport system permease small subunit